MYSIPKSDLKWYGYRPMYTFYKQLLYISNTGRAIFPLITIVIFRLFASRGTRESIKVTGRPKIQQSQEKKLPYSVAYKGVAYKNVYIGL